MRIVSSPTPALLRTAHSPPPPTHAQVVAEGQIIHVSILAVQTEDILLDVVLALQHANLEVKRGNVESKLVQVS